MKQSDILSSLQERVFLRALDIIDQDALAESLSKSLVKTMQEDIESFFSEEFDFYDFLREELFNSRTNAGKTFQKAMKGVANTMADSLLKVSSTYKS